MINFALGSHCICRLMVRSSSPSTTRKKATANPHRSNSSTGGFLLPTRRLFNSRFFNTAYLTTWAGKAEAGSPCFRASSLAVDHSPHCLGVILAVALGMSFLISIPKSRSIILALLSRYKVANVGLLVSLAMAVFFCVLNSLLRCAISALVRAIYFTPFFRRLRDSYA